MIQPNYKYWQMRYAKSATYRHVLRRVSRLFQRGLWAILFILLFSSCKPQQRWIKKGERNGWFGKDSTQQVNIKGETKLNLDSLKTDSVINALTDKFMRMLDSCAAKPTNPTDSIIHEAAKKNVATKLKKEVTDLVKSIPCKISPIHEETNKFRLSIWNEGEKLLYDLEIKPQEKKCPECPDCKKIRWFEWWYIGVIGTLLLILGLGYIKKSIK